METNNFSNEQQLPEKGVEKVDNQMIDQEESILTPHSVVNEKQSETSIEADSKVGEGDATIVQAEKSGQKELPKEIHYSKLSKKELLLQMNELIRHYKLEAIKNAVEEIRANFYKKHKAEVEVAKEKFEQEGGKIEEFKFIDADEEAFKELYRQFKRKKQEANLLLENEKKKNLQQKQSIVEEIRELINKEEAINKTFQEFRNLQQKWHTIGLVPQNDVKNLWETYHHAVESFYDYVKINKELRDLDLKKNLEEKESLCQKTEELLDKKDILKAFKMLQEYHNLWREIGPVPHKNKEPIWERFKATTSILNKRHQDFYDELRKRQKENLEEKKVLCEEIEEIIENKLKHLGHIKNWSALSQRVIELQKKWKTIGHASRKEETKIYKRFRKGCNYFFSKRQGALKEVKELYKQNLAKKVALCEKAELEKDSTNWKKSTEVFFNLQQDWKKIGHVDLRDSKPIWERFCKACEEFFEAKNQHFASSIEEQEENLKLKKALIEKVKNIEISTDKKEVINQIKTYQKEWAEIGHVPFKKKDEVAIAFNESIEELLKKLKIAKSEIDKINFKNKVNHWASEKSRGKLYHERSKLIAQIKELENEIALYENNIGFFTESSNSSKMLKEVNKKIKQAKERMFDFKDKLRILDKLDF